MVAAKFKSTLEVQEGMAWTSQGRLVSAPASIRLFDCLYGCIDQLQTIEEELWIKH